MIGDADAPVKLNQIRADAEQNVLAIVDNFAGAGVFVGRCASAEKWAALEEGDAESSIGERASRGESGESSSGDGHCGWVRAGDIQFYVTRITKPRASTLSFSRVLRATFSVKTSYCFSAMRSRSRR